MDTPPGSELEGENVEEGRAHDRPFIPSGAPVFLIVMMQNDRIAPRGRLTGPERDLREFSHSERTES
jgi:hypothetical protein